MFLVMRMEKSKPVSINFLLSEYQNSVIEKWDDFYKRFLLLLPIVESPKLETSFNVHANIFTYSDKHSSSPNFSSGSHPVTQIKIYPCRNRRASELYLAK